MTGAPRIAPEALAAVRAALPLDALIGETVALRRKGGEYVGLCPFHDEKTPSFTVVPRKGFYHCFGCGAHGDVIGWAMRAWGLDFAGAVEQLQARAGLGGEAAGPNKTPPPRKTSQIPDSRAQDKTVAARALFAAALPIDGTLAERYLKARALDPARLGDARCSLRFAPALRHGPSGRTCPAMLAAFKLAGRVVAVHRTFLADDGRGKADVTPAKMILASYQGAAIRLDPAGPLLAVAEGIETGLSVRQAVPDLPVWVAGALGNIAGGGKGRGHFHPEGKKARDGRALRLPAEWPDMDRPGIRLPDCVRDVVLLADGDTKDRHVGRALMRRAARRFQLEGRQVRIAWPDDGQDFNDMLMAGAA